MNRFVEAHGPALARYHGFLELVTPKAFAMYEDEFPDISEVPGDALCSAVRALLRRRGERVPAGECTLQFVPRGNSRQLVDLEGVTVRIRRHPWDHRRCCRVAVTDPPVYTLFGTDWSLAPYELAILWTPHFKTKSLGNAVLAAVGDLDGSAPKIFARMDLPTADVLNLAPPVVTATATRMGEVTDDFEDFFGDESLGTDDPA